MMIDPVMTGPMAAAAGVGAMGKSQASYAEVFQKIANPKDYAARRKQAEEAATGLVSQALILPILKQIRRSPFNGEGPFSPGTGEKTFGPEFDMQIADRIAQSPKLGIKKALADRLMKHGGPVAQQKVDVRG